MSGWVQMILALALGILASSGFWAFIQYKLNRRSQTSLLMMGIAYKDIIVTGREYIDRGWITDDEYGDFRRYLYDPYKSLGGNGVTERIMAAVANLPVKPRSAYADLIHGTQNRSTTSDTSDAPSDDEYANAASQR